MASKKMKLSDVCRRLCVPYHKLFHQVVCGAVPATRDGTGTRWLINETDLEKVANVLGVALHDGGRNA
jgi:hypothetical protein